MMSSAGAATSRIAALSSLCIAGGFAVGCFYGGADSILFLPAIGLIVAGWILSLMPFRALHLPSGAIGWALLALTSWITLTLPFSLAPFQSLLTWLMFLCLPLTFMALPGRLAWGAIVAVLLCGAGCAVLQVTILRPLFGGRADWPFQDANNLAALLNLGLLPVLIAFQRSATRGKALLRGVAVLLLFAGLIATGSRGGLIAFAVMAMLALLLTPTDWRRLLPLFASMILIAVLLMRSGGGVPSRLAGLADVGNDANSMSRLAIWQATIPMIADHPLFGQGFGSFYLAYPAYRLPADRLSTGQFAHHDPLQYAVEMGIPAAILLYALMAACAVIGFRALRRGRRESLAPLLALGTLALHMHVEFQLYLPPVLVASGVLMGWLHRAAGEPVATIALDGPQRIVIAVTACVIAGLILLPATRAALGLHYTAVANRAIQAGRSGEFLASLGKADRVAPLSFIDAGLARDGFYIDLLRTPDGLFSRSEQHQLADSVLGDLQAAEQTTPLRPEVNLRRAALYAAMQVKLEPDWATIAADQYRVALAKNPLDARARYRLAALLIDHQRIAEAEAVIAAGKTWPRIGPQQDMDGLTARIEQAKQKDPRP